MIQKKTSELRKLSMLGFDAVRNAHNFYAILEFDITDLRKYLREKRRSGESGSLFAFLLKVIATCLKEYPVFNSMIDSRKTSEFESVDISIPIEITRDGVVENKQQLLRNVDTKSIKEISDEIDKSKQTIDDQKGYVVSKPLQLLMSILPGTLVRFFIKQVLKNHERVKKLSGTVFVTSVSMFSTVPGYVIPFIGGPKACSFAIGSSVKKPIVKNNEIVIREIINITAIFNHDIIDGAPAARFINQFRKYIEIDYDSIL